MARRQSRIRCNPKSWECKELISRNKKSRRAKRSDVTPAQYRGYRQKPKDTPTFRQYISEMGFADYAEYLASDLWQMIRKQAFVRWGRMCKCCGGTATQLHHADYKLGTLKGTTNDSLWPVCNECHRAAHANSRELTAANRWIKQQWRKRKDRAYNDSDRQGSS